MGFSKRSAVGGIERLGLVVKEFNVGFGDALRIADGKVELTDLLDAFAALWSARRMLASSHRTFPEQAIADSQGVKMQMFA